jgi:DNA-binding transcriptional regulator YbjK
MSELLVVQLLSGLVVNGLSAFLGRALTELESESHSLQATVSKALKESSDIEAIIDDLGGEDLRGFLNGPEAFAVVHRVYAASDARDESGLEQLKREFVSLLLYRLNRTGESSTARAEALFISLVSICQFALKETIEDEELVALDSMAQLRHRQLLSRFELVQGAIDELVTKRVGPQDLDEFIHRYKQQVRQREGKIVPPDFDVATKVPIDDLYVESPVRELSEDDDRVPQVLAYAELFGSIGRKVVLGNPGSGKSTLAKKLVADFTRTSPEPAPQLVPFLIVLRDYGARKAEASCSVRDFIEARIASHYQLDPPPGVVEYILSSGAAVVVFDGLDELIDTSYRQQVSADIESFASAYPLIEILVTSREVGYPQAPLDPTVFDAFQLATFGDEQVEAYVTKWFARDADLSRAERTQQVESFLSESSIVPDIRSNPLMLALMCNLYKGEGYIPRNRPDVFERCAVMLFDRWDRQRQIKVPLEIESHIRPAMQYLAHWIYTDAGLEAAVPESAIVKKTTEYLVGRRYDDATEAEAEAQRFVEFCAGRAWVFTDLGTTGSGERLYNFTHRTFLEYFTAGHLVRLLPDATRLSEVLVPHIEKREWDVVAQLAYQMLDKNVEGAGGELLKCLIQFTAALDDAKALNRLDFAIRTLEFLVPPPSVVRDIVETGVRGVLTYVATDEATRDAPRFPTLEDRTPLDVLEHLASASPENEAAVIASLVDNVGTYLDRQSTNVSAAELGLMLGRRFPIALDEAFLRTYDRKLSELGGRDMGIAVELVTRGKWTAESFCEIYGVEALFESSEVELKVSRVRTAMALSVIYGAFDNASRLWAHMDAVVARRVLDELAGILMAKAPPWNKEDTSTLGIIWSSVRPAEDFDRSELTPDQWFSAIALVAALAEGAEVHTDPSVKSRRVLSELVENLPYLPPIIKARYDSQYQDDAREAEKALGLSDEQRTLLSDWRAGTLSLAE